MLIISQIQTIPETITNLLVARFFVPVFWAGLLGCSYQGWYWGQQLLGKAIWISLGFYAIARWLSVNHFHLGSLLLIGCLYGLAIGLQIAYFQNCWPQRRW